MRRNREIRRKGFTLVELLVVIVILAMLSGIVAPKLIGQIDKAKFDSCLPKMAPLETAIDTYLLNTGYYPDTLEDLLYCPSGLEDVWAGPYLNKEAQLYDPWDRAYMYELTDTGYVIISYGADGAPSGEGYNRDIYSN